MTQEQVPDDEISQAQRELDAEQGQTQVDPNDQLRQLIESQAELLRNQGAQIAGLQGKIDQGLNAIRRDTEAIASKQVGDLKSEIGRANLLASIEDDGERSRTEMLLNEMDKLKPQTAPVETPQVPQQAPQGMEQVYGVVEGMGLKRNDPRINYAALNDQTLTEAQRGQVFLNSMKTAIQADATQAPTPTPARQENPPVDDGNSLVTGENYRNVDSLLDAYTAGKLNSTEDPNGTKEYHRRLALLGGIPQ